MSKEKETEIEGDPPKIWCVIESLPRAFSREVAGYKAKEEAIEACKEKALTRPGATFLVFEIIFWATANPQPPLLDSGSTFINWN